MYLEENISIKLLLIMKLFLMYILKIFYLKFRCSTAAKKYTEKPKKIFQHLNFKKEIKAGIQRIEKLQYYVLLMTDNNLLETNKKELGYLLHSIVEDSRSSYYFVSDELNKIISAQSLSW